MVNYMALHGSGVLSLRVPIYLQFAYNHLTFTHRAASNSPFQSRVPKEKMSAENMTSNVYSLKRLHVPHGKKMPLKRAPKEERKKV